LRYNELKLNQCRNKHSCLLAPPTGPTPGIEHLRQVGGSELEKLLEGLEFCSPRQKMLVCQGARAAVPGIYPFVFTDRGYHGQLDWLGDTAAYKAPIADHSYVTLLAVAKEGAVTLPQHIMVELTSGQQVYLGPKLTTPKPGPLAKRTTLTMTVTSEGAVIRHLATEEEVVADGAEGEDLPDLVDGETDDEEEREEEMQKEAVVDKEGNSELSKEEQEKEQEMEQEKKEMQEEDKYRRKEEKQSRADSQRDFQKTDDNV
jgi:hypothetical protein